MRNILALGALVLPALVLAGNTTVDLTSYYDWDLHTMYAAPPSGNVTMGGVPFFFQPTGNGTVATNDFGSITVPISQFTIPVHLQSSAVYIVMTGSWVPYPNFRWGLITLNYTTGGPFSVPLWTGYNIRDWVKSKSNNVTTTTAPYVQEVWRGDPASGLDFYPNTAIFDMMTLDADPTRTLDSVTFQGDPPYHRGIVMSAMTVDAVPEPSEWLAGVGALGFLGLCRRRRRGYRGRRVVRMAGLLAAFALPMIAAAGNVPVDLTLNYNYDLRNMYAAPPTGSITLGGVPFFFQPTGNDTVATNDGGSIKVPDTEFTIAVHKQVATVYIILTASYCTAQTDWGLIQFNYASGAPWTLQLTSGYNIRDWVKSLDPNITTTTAPYVEEVWRGDPAPGLTHYKGTAIFDMMTLSADPGRSLDSIAFYDHRDVKGGLVMSGMTVNVVPEPASIAMGFAPIAAFGFRLLRRASGRKSGASR